MLLAVYMAYINIYQCTLFFNQNQVGYDLLALKHSTTKKKKKKEYKMSSELDLVYLVNY